MLEWYWGCLITGLILSLATLLFGEVLEGVMDGLFSGIAGDWLNPTVWVGGLSVFGGTGLMLTDWTELGAVTVAGMSAMAAAVLSAGSYFFYVRPMKNSENSTAFSIQDLGGQLGTVSVSVPAQGYGEVMVRSGTGYTNQIAASLDRTPLRSGEKIVVVDIRDGVLFVSRLDELN